MIDPQEETTVGLLPFRVTFVRWKIDELQIVAVRILEIESLNAGCGLVPIGNPLRAGGGVLYFVGAQLLVGLVHIAHDDSDMLEPLIVAARVRGDRSASRREIFAELDQLIAQSH